MKTILKSFSAIGVLSILADAMANVKTGFKGVGYYQKEFTQEQLDIAKKIWELSPEITTEMEYDHDAFMIIENLG